MRKDLLVVLIIILAGLWYAFGDSKPGEEMNLADPYQRQVDQAKALQGQIMDEAAKREAQSNKQ